MNWLRAYDIDTGEHPSQLGEPATVTIILRELMTDERSFVFLPISPVPPGDAQREAVARVLTGRFPDARQKTYNPEKQVASFVGKRHLYIAIYEEHEVEPRETPQARLFAA